MLSLKVVVLLCFIACVLGQGPRFINHPDDGHHVRKASCHVCKQLIGSIMEKTVVEDTDDFKEHVNTSCGNLSDIYTTECYHILVKYGRKIAELLSTQKNVDSNQVCEKLRVC